MNIEPSPFAPSQFPDLPAIAGVKAATASRGFYAGRGIERDDVFLFSFAPETVCAGVFTQSMTASADVAWCRQALAQGGGAAQALIVNSGNSNAFTGPKGELKNRATLAALEASLAVQRQNCFIGATGVIGEPLSDPNFVGSIVPKLAAKLGDIDWQACAKAFMTTDTYPKGAGATCTVSDCKVQFSGIAKGSGMIAPNMATMLAYIFTDASITPNVLDAIVRDTCNRTFNAITVDGDTSTSDTLMVFATGEAANPVIDDINHPDVPAFATALETVMRDLAIQIVKDGEGATKFISVNVTGASDTDSAKKIAAAIGNSPLVKTALAAGDANWGRIVMAVGKAGVEIDQSQLAIWFNHIQVAEAGARSASYDEAEATAQCAHPEITITVNLGNGAGAFTLYTCDLTHAYIDINGAYRT